MEQSEGCPKIVLKSLGTKFFSHIRHLAKALDGRGSPDKRFPDGGPWEEFPDP